MANPVVTRTTNSSMERSLRTPDPRRQLRQRPRGASSGYLPTALRNHPEADRSGLVQLLKTHRQPTVTPYFGGMGVNSVPVRKTLASRQSGVHLDVTLLPT